RIEPPERMVQREAERRHRPVGGRVARPARLAPPGRRQEDAAQVERMDQAVVDDRVHVVEQERAAERVGVAGERDQRDGGEPPAAKCSVTFFNPSTFKYLSHTLSTARLMSRSIRSASRLSSPTYSSSILPAAEARMEWRSVRRGTISRSLRRTARFSALETRLS